MIGGYIMAKINTFVYCMRTEQNNTGSTTAVDIRTVLMLDFLPTAFTFGIVACISGLDYNKNYSFSYKILNENKSEIYDTNQIDVPYAQIRKDDPNLGIVPIEDDGITISLMFNNVVFRKEGRYTTEVYVDGSLIGERTFYVAIKREII